MRRLLSVSKISLLTLSLVFIVAQISLAATNQSIFEYMNLGTDDNLENFSLDDIEFDSNTPNAYLAISKFYLKDGEDLALSNISYDFAVSKSDAKAVILNNGVLPDTDQAFSERMRVRYKAILADIYQIQKQKVTVFAREVFMNNSDSDSPYDLLLDLTEIEDIIFKTNSQILLDGTSNTQSLSKATDFISQAPVQAQSVSSAVPTQPQDPETFDPNQPQDPETLEPTLETTAPTLTPTIPSPNSAECEIDPQLSEQLDQFDNQQQTTSSNTPQPPNQSNSQNPTQNDTPPESPDTNQADNTGQNSGVSSQNSMKFSDYPNLELECGDDQIFCLKKEEVMGRWGLVIPSERECIKCQLDLITEYLKDLLAKNLMPKKVTGNIGEFPYCKNELSKGFLSFNFSIFSKPLRPADPTTEITNSEIKDVLPVQAPKEQIVQAPKTELPQDPEQARIQEAIDKANREFALFQSQISDLTQGYDDLIERIGLFNKNLQSITTGFNSIRDSITSITTKPACQ